MALPPGVYETNITVHVEREDPNDPREIETTLRAESGSFDDVHARETTYTCDRRFPGSVEICVGAEWVDGGEAMSVRGDAPVGSSSQYLRRPHIRDRPDCSSTRCIQVACPEGPCP
jgi:hypothetical protein